ncbi:MAG: hypothetical protein DRJ01_18590, partial [Bacteroidetes bacterium]
KKEKVLEKISKDVWNGIELIRRMRELEIFVTSHKDLEIYSVLEVLLNVKNNYSATKFNITGDCHILADKALNSVFDNIIRNAIMHGKADIINIDIVGKGKICEVRIADTGNGIPDEIKEKLFEEGVKYGKTGHTGLGLYIVKKAMENYGGNVYIENNKPTGTIFVLVFKRIT